MSNYLRCVPSPPTCTRRLQQVQHRSCCLLCLSQPGLMRVVSSRMFTSELCWRISACDSSATLVSLTPQPVSPRPSLHSLSSPWSHLLSVLCCCCCGAVPIGKSTPWWTLLTSQWVPGGGHSWLLLCRGLILVLVLSSSILSIVKVYCFYPGSFFSLGCTEDAANLSSYLEILIFY